MCQKVRRRTENGQNPMFCMMFHAHAPTLVHLLPDSAVPASTHGSLGRGIPGGHSVPHPCRPARGWYHTSRRSRLEPSTNPNNTERPRHSPDRGTGEWVGPVLVGEESSACLDVVEEDQVCKLQRMQSVLQTPWNSKNVEGLIHQGIYIRQTFPRFLPSLQ